MSTTWYQVRGFSGCYIEEVEVIKETKHCLITPRGRQKKHSDYVASFATKEEAIDYARKKTQREIELLTGRIKE